MITGVVNDALEPMLSLTVQGPQGQERQLEAVIDTGYSGTLNLPPQVITALNLPMIGEDYIMLADGTVRRSPKFSGTLVWGGHARRVEVDAAGAEALIGMELLEGHELWIEAIPGGTVTITPLP